ncbi:MAG: hypothetical protein AAFY24_06025 [Pseudomonadota bacterium]
MDEKPNLRSGHVILDIIMFIFSILEKVMRSLEQLTNGGERPKTLRK